MKQSGISLIKKIFCLIVIIGSYVITSKAETADSLLLKTCTRQSLKQMIVQGTAWVPYPAYKNRTEWEKRISGEVRESVIRSGEKALKYEWKPNLASQYMAYKKQGKILTNRDNYLALQALMLAELAEGKGRFMNAIIDGVWFMSETSWQHASLLVFQKDKTGLPDPEEPTIELVVADVGAEMAWAYYFFKEEFDKTSPMIAREIKKAVYRKMIEPYFAREDYWWMGFSGKRVNNWNIWVNYNVLQAISLLEEDMEKRTAYTYQLLRSAEWFLRAYEQDGACDEGPTYWGHAGANLYKFLELVAKVTDNHINLFGNEKVKNIGRYIYRANIVDNFFVNFSDAAVEGNIKPGLVYGYGKAIEDEVMMNFAAEYERKFPTKNYIGGCFATVLDEILTAEELKEGGTYDNMIPSHFFPNSELAIARDSQKGKEGFYFAALGSHNGQSHNHNDVGSCMMFFNGKPVLIDVGVGTYTKKTFSGQRYTIWTMQSCYHNLPTINGYDQKNGTKFRAKNMTFRDKGNTVKCAMDIEKAYPEEAGIDTWNRTYTLVRGKQFVIEDKWKINELKGKTTFHFMTACKVLLKEKDIELEGDGFKLKMSFDYENFEPTIEKVSFKDAKLKASWKDGYVTRISFNAKNMKKNGKSKFVISKY